jgi:transcriptional regulator with XRE-family HTH domain
MIKDHKRENPKKIRELGRKELVRLREERGWTQKLLAEKLGETWETISRWERKGWTKKKIGLALSAVFGLSPQHFERLTKARPYEEIPEMLYISDLSPEGRLIVKDIVRSLSLCVKEKEEFYKCAVKVERTGSKEMVQLVGRQLQIFAEAVRESNSRGVL